MNKFWKSKLEYNIQKFINKNKDKKIIFIGLNTHYRNPRIYVKIDAIFKYFIKLNLISNAKNIIEYNLDHHRNEIIDGTFPLQYLEPDFLIKKREMLQNTYIKIGYKLKSIKNIIQSIDINIKNNNNFNHINKIYIGTNTKLDGKIYPFSQGQLIGYSNEWLALLSIIGKSNNLLKKGFLNNKPFIKELKKGGLNTLNKNGYIYEVNKNNFAYHEKGKSFKFVSNKPSKIEKRIFVPNIYKKLKEDYNIKIISYK